MNKTAVTVQVTNAHIPPSARQQCGGAGNADAGDGLPLDPRWTCGGVT